MRFSILQVTATIVVGLLVMTCASAPSPTRPPSPLPTSSRLPPNPLPTQSTSAVNPVGARIAAGFGNTCALTSGGGVRCWGANSAGQAGNGTTTESLVPVDVSGLASGVSAIATGGYHTCALLSGGGVKCWGVNLFGQLGNSSTTDSNVPVDVSGLASGVSAISAGFHHTCAISSDGGVTCWGANEFGQLGNGTTANSNVPINAKGLATGVSAIAAGHEHTCALTWGGRVQCWGSNGSGQLGNGTTTTSSVPVDVSRLAGGVSAIAAGSRHTCALTSGRGIRCWGMNGFGQLGNGTTIDSNTPVDVSGLASGVSAIAAGAEHACVLTLGDAVKCWGSNWAGQLGDGSLTDSLVPGDVASLTSGVSAIAVGYRHTCALLSGGGIKCWGEDAGGPLGNGSTTGSRVPVDVDLAAPSASTEPPAPISAALPIRGSALDGSAVRAILMAPGPGGSLYVSISAPAGPVRLALLDQAGIPQAGWPVVLADTVSCELLLPVGDGSVRVVCTLENPGNLYDPMGAFALDAKGAMLAGWPAVLGCCITDGHLVGDALVLLASSPTTDVEPVPAGQPVSIQQVSTVAADGSIRRGVQVPMFANEPDGVADNIALVSGFEDGIESRPSLGPDGRIVITVGSFKRSATRVLIFDLDRKTVLARSAELPIASVEKPSDPEVCAVRTPNPPIVAVDGTVFVFSELDPRVFALDSSLEVVRGWPYRPSTPMVRDPFSWCSDPRGTPTVGPDSTLYLPLQARDATVGGSIVAVGPDGRVRPGWPVVLSRVGAGFWSVVVGSDGTVFALAIEPEGGNTSSASILAIAPDSTVLYTTTIIDP